MKATDSRIAVLYLVAAFATACSPTASESGTSGDGSRAGRASQETNWSSLGDIAYVLPRELPSGWTVKIATERPGRPQSEWQDHIELLSKSDRDSYLILTAHRSTTSTDSVSPPTSGEPGAIDDFDASQFSFLLAYLLPQDASGSLIDLPTRRVRWQANDLEFTVSHIAAQPDDRLIQTVADDLARDAELDFHIPPSATAAGYEAIGSSNSGPPDVTDYTISWVPAEIAGANRAAALEAPDDGPLLFMNVGARFFTQSKTSLPSAPEDAPITREEGLLRMEFLLDGSLVTIGGREIEEEVVRSFANSLTELDRAEWRQRLGERLLVDRSA